MSWPWRRKVGAGLEPMPEMPRASGGNRPESIALPLLVASGHVALGFVELAGLPGVAEQALIDGHDSPSMLKLAIAEEDEIRWEGETWLRDAFKELGFQWPSNEEAGLLVFAESAWRFLEGRHGIEQLLRDAARLWPMLDYPSGPLQETAILNDHYGAGWSPYSDAQIVDEVTRDALDVASTVRGIVSRLAHARTID